MSFLDSLKKKSSEIAQGVYRQLNPLDGGATYSNPRPNVPQQVQQSIQNAKYGVLANNPQKQNAFLNDLNSKPNPFMTGVRAGLNSYGRFYNPANLVNRNQIITDNTDAPIKAIQFQARNGQLNKNLASARINALATSSNAKTNQFENSASFNPANTSKVGGAIINTSANRKLAPVTSGMYRSAIGTGEGLSGLYDLATPGKGNNRIGQAIRNQGAIVDNSVKQNNYNKLAYKAGQVGTDVATFMLPGGVTSKVTGTIGKVATKTPVLKTAIGAVNKSANAGNVIAKGGRYLLSPSNLVNTASDTALSSGLRANRGQDISPTTLAIDAGTSLGMSGAVGLTGAGLKKVSSPVIKSIKSVTEKQPIPQLLQETRNKAVVGYNEALAKGNKAAIQHYDNLIKTVDGQIAKATQSKLMERLTTPINRYGGINADFESPTIINGLTGKEIPNPNYKKPSIDPLEALKAEASQQKFYHGGTPVDKASIANSDLGYSVSTDKNVSKWFTNSKNGGKVTEHSISPNAKILQAKDIPQELLDGYTKLDPNLSVIDNLQQGPARIKDAERQIVAYARQNGYDAIDMRGEPFVLKGSGVLDNEAEIRVLNPDILDTQPTPPVQKPAVPEATKVVPLTKKVKTVYKTDKQLKKLNKVLKDVVGAESSNLDNRNIIKEVRDAGGIGSSAYGSLPKSVINKNGRSADYLARELGYPSEDALVEAIQNYKQIPKKVAEEQAISRLKSGNSPFSEDYKTAIDQFNKRKSELSLLPIDAKVTNQKPSALSEAEWNSIAETAPMNAVTKKQAIGTELSSVRAELESLKATKAQLNERQRLQVISGNQQVATAMRESNAKMQEQINALKAKERELAKNYAVESGSKHNTGKNMSSQEAAQELLQTKDLKDKQTKKTFMGYTNDYVGGLKSAELDAQLKSRQFSEKFNLTDDQKLEFLKASDDPTYKTSDKIVQKAVNEAHKIYDQAYKDLTDSGVKMGYQASYSPRIYKHPVSGEPITAPEYNLYTRSARQAGRKSETLDVDNLITKDPAEAMKMYFSSIQKAAAGQKYLKNLENDGLVIKSSEPVRGMRPIVAEGMQSPDGLFYYAKKDVADKLNNMYGNKEASNFVEKLAEKGAGVNSAFQSFVLSGGIPNTPVNAFGFMQVMKETMALHPIKAGKAFYTGLNKEFAKNLFTSKADTIKRMAENGVNVRVDLDAIAKSGRQRIGETEGLQKINKAWDEFTNDATFKRFMPALEVMHFENVEKGLIRRGVEPKIAAQKAAESVKNFYGKTDMANEATRSKLTNDAVGATLFAPRFRESMLNFWGKNIKALDPRGGFKNARSVEYRDNVKFLVSSAAVYAAMDGVNYALNGTHMYQNPDGKKDKLLIPNGDQYIGIPFLPSVSTVPRNLTMGAYNLATGNLNEAGKNVKSFLSMPLRTAGDIITNENYFGAPIVSKDAQGIEKPIQVGAYIAKNNMQPWIREGLNASLQGAPDETKKLLGIKKQSAAQTASQALELPARFYDAANMKGGSDKFGANNPGMLQAKANKSKTESAKELSLAKQQALKAFGYSGKSESDINTLAKSGDQNAQDALKNIKLLNKALGTTDLPNGLSENEQYAINRWNRLNPSGRAGVLVREPNAKNEYDIAHLKERLLNDEITQEQYNTDLAKLNKKSSNKVSTKKSGGKSGRGKLPAFRPVDFKTGNVKSIVKAPSVKKAVFKRKKTATTKKK